MKVKVKKIDSSNQANVRERLLRTTGNLLARQGYHGTGLNQIIAESKTPKGSLYHYFPEGKEQLALEALAFTTREWFLKIESILQKAANPSQAIEKICRFLADDLLNSGWENGCPIATIVLEVASQMDSIHVLATKHWQSWEKAIANYLLLHNCKPDDEIINLVVTSLEGALLLSRAYRKKEPLLKTGRTLAKLLKEL